MNICKLKHRSNPEMKRWLFFIILLSISQSTIQINYAQIKDRDIKKINQHKNNAVLLEKQNKYDEAIKEWQAITDFEGVDDSIVKEAFINMAKIYSKKGGTSFGFAVNALKTVLQIDPSDFKAHYDLGVIYFDKKLYKDETRLGNLFTLFSVLSLYPPLQYQLPCPGQRKPGPAKNL